MIYIKDCQSYMWYILYAIKNMIYDTIYILKYKVYNIDSIINNQKQ